MTGGSITDFNIRRALAMGCALVLTAFALPGNAAKPGKFYDLQFLLPATVNGQPNPTYKSDG